MLPLGLVPERGTIYSIFVKSREDHGGGSFLLCVSLGRVSMLILILASEKRIQFNWSCMIEFLQRIQPPSQVAT